MVLKKKVGILSTKNPTIIATKKMKRLKQDFNGVFYKKVKNWEDLKQVYMDMYNKRLYLGYIRYKR